MTEGDESESVKEEDEQQVLSTREKKHLKVCSCRDLILQNESYTIICKGLNMANDPMYAV